MNSAEVFLDSDILLYAAGGRKSTPEKHKRAVELLALPFGVSAQVLSEFYDTALSAGPQPLSSKSAREWITHLSKKPCQALDDIIIRKAIDVSETHDLRFRDCTIIAAAQRLGVKTLYSGDIPPNDYGDLELVNPFLEVI